MQEAAPMLKPYLGLALALVIYGMGLWKLRRMLRKLQE